MDFTQTQKYEKTKNDIAKIDKLMKAGVGIPFKEQQFAFYRYWRKVLEEVDFCVAKGGQQQECYAQA